MQSTGSEVSNVRGDHPHCTGLVVHATSLPRAVALDDQSLEDIGLDPYETPDRRIQF